MQRKIGCVIMASGMAKRFGSNKLLYEINGKPMIAGILDATDQISRRIVVTRHPEIVKICEDRNVNVLLHDLPQRRDTIRLGLQYLLSQHPQPCGCLFAAADQPCLSRRSIEALCRSFYREPECIHRLSFRGEPGNPVLFPKSCFDALLTLPAHTGGRALIQRSPETVRLIEVSDERELLDADTPEMLTRLMKM